MYNFFPRMLSRFHSRLRVLTPSWPRLSFAQSPIRFKVFARHAGCFVQVESYYCWSMCSVIVSSSELQ